MSDAVLPWDGDAIDAGAPDPLDRFTYGLGFKKAKRTIDSGGLGGPNITNAYAGKGPSSGRWDCEINDANYDALVHVLSCVINEAIHEALEWLRFDGGILIDPHGKYDGDVFDAASACVDALMPAAKAKVLG